MLAQSACPLVTLLAPLQHEEIVAFVPKEDRAELRASCKYFRDVVDRRTTSLELKPRAGPTKVGGLFAARPTAREVVTVLPAGLLAKFPNLTRIDFHYWWRACQFEADVKIFVAGRFRAMPIRKWARVGEGTFAPHWSLVIY